MTAVKHHEADKFIQAPSAGIFLYLVFGSDPGLISERISAIAAANKRRTNSDYEIVRLDGDSLAQDPMLLIDEANAISMFSQGRILAIRNGTKSFLTSLETLLADPPIQCLIIVEAGQLRREAPIRALCTKSALAAAIECYPDNTRDIERLVDAEAAAGRLPLDRDARNLLITLLGADRLGTRGEIEKLSLYCHNKARVMEDDIREVVTNASALAIDDVVDAIFRNDKPVTYEMLTRLFATGTPPDVVLSAALRHALFLHRIFLEIQTGKPMQVAVESALPRNIPFTKKNAVTEQLRLWSAEKLLRAFAILRDASFRIRIEARISELLASRAMIAIASMARKQDAKQRQ